MNYTDCINVLTKINESIINSSKLDIIEYLVPFILGIIGTLVGVIFGYVFSKKQESSSFNINCHIEYLKYINEMFFKMNVIKNDINNIEKFGRDLLKEKFDLFSFQSQKDNFLDLGLKIKTLQSFLLSNTELFIGNDRGKSKYYNAVIEASSSITALNTINNIIDDFEKQSINYYWLIDKSFRDKHTVLLTQLSDYVIHNMDGFNIESFCDSLSAYIIEINNYIRIKNGLKKIA